MTFQIRGILWFQGISFASVPFCNQFAVQSKGKLEIGNVNVFLLEDVLARTVTCSMDAKATDDMVRKSRIP
jgi:hypothetical protein